MNNEKQKQITLIRETLEQMQGLKYNYGNKVHTITSYRIDEVKERVYVSTDKRHYDRDFEGILQFLNNLEPVQERAVSRQSGNEMPEFPTMQINSQVIGQLKDVLMDNIEKVKKDKEYLQQAATVKQSVDSIIDLAKIEVAYMEAYVRMNKI